MKQEAHKKYNRILHLLVISCLLMPFFYTGCRKEAAPEASSIDSTAVVTDTCAVEGAAIKSSTLSTKNDSVQKDNNLTVTPEPKKELSYAEEIAVAYPFLKKVLIPGEDKLSGIAVIINYLQYAFLLFMMVLPFTLVISLLIKFIEPQALRSIFLIDIVSFILLFFSVSPSFNCEKLWGYWVCLSLLGLLVIHDFFRIKIAKKE